MNGQDQMLSETAHRVLTQLGDENDLDTFIAGLKNAKHTLERQGYIYALGRVGGPRAAAALLEEFYRPSQQLTYIVDLISSLEQIGTHEAIEGIHMWLASELGKQHVEAQAAHRLNALEVSPPEFRQQLVEGWLHEPPPDDPRPETTNYLLNITYEALAQALHMPQYREMVVETLEKADTQQAGDILAAWRREPWRVSVGRIQAPGIAHPKPATLISPFCDN